MAGSISGLSSGLDTSTIINQLMSLEAKPQADLKARLADQQTRLTLLQTQNSRFASIATAAKALSLPAAWTAVKGTSSEPTVTVTAGTAATTGSINMTVNQTARAQLNVFNDKHALTDTVVSGGTQVTLTVNGTAKTIETGDGTLQGLVKALNASGTGVRAGVVKLDDGTMRVNVEATTSGTAGAFILTNTDSSDLMGGASVTPGRKASITVGPDVITSDSNTFKDLMPGVNVTVTEAAIGKTATVSTAQDASSAQNQVKGLIDLVNSALDGLKGATASNQNVKERGALAGDPNLTALRDRLLSAVFATDATSMAKYGVTLDRSGKVNFDAAKFQAAYTADPANTQRAFTTSGSGAPGYAERVAKVADVASNSKTGMISGLITGTNSSIKTTQKSIDSWDDRLSLRRQTLERTFTALETTLSKTKSQSDWLTGQLSSLMK